MVILNNVQQINTLIEGQTGGMAAAYGAPAGSYTQAVIMSGFVNTVVGSLNTITAGWCFYNGLYVYFAGGSCTLTGSNVPLFTITVVNGLPIATLASHATAADATHFAFGVMVTAAAALGIVAINANLANAEANIVVLENNVAIAGWNPLSTFLNSYWNSHTSPQIARVCNDGMGRVYTNGAVYPTAGFGTLVMTYPAGFRPTQTTRFCLSVQYTSGTIWRSIPCSIDTDGTLNILNSGDLTDLVLLDLGGIPPFLVI